MQVTISDEIIKYCEDHSDDLPNYINDLGKYTVENVHGARMLSGPVQGKFLRLLIKLRQPKFILEIGTYTGYSALCMAEGLSPDSELHSLEIDKKMQNIHERFISRSPFASQIFIHYQDAKEYIQASRKKWDLVFLDADKKSYIYYLQQLENRLESGAVVVSDNVLWSGRVLEDNQDDNTEALKDYNTYLRASDKWEAFILPLRDGIGIAVRK